MKILSRWSGAILLLPGLALAESFDTEIPGVTAEVTELRSAGGVTRLLVKYQNDGPAGAETGRIEFGAVALVDVASKQKHFPIQDADGRYIGGPIADAISGGRAYLKLPPGRSGTLWAYYDAIPPGTVVSVELPQMFPFDDVTVTDGAGTALTPVVAGSIPSGAVARLVSAKRADQALKVRLKLEAETGVMVMPRSPYFEYKNVYLFDPAAQRRYPLLTDPEGTFQATPLGQAIDGGTFLPNWSSPILMSLTFPAPPDDVTAADLMLADFLPLEGVAIEGLGGAAATGIAASGRTIGLEAALRELGAQVNAEEIEINLAGDLLFDFDRDELQPAAEDKLGQLLTVIQSRPAAAVSIEGHTDVRGAADYNQALSLRRAEAVRDWLVAHGVASPRLTATGAGASRPVDPGTTDAAHQANRRVEIRIRGS